MKKGASVVLSIVLAGVGMNGCVTHSYIPEFDRIQISRQADCKKYVAIFDGLGAAGWAIDIQNSLGSGYVGFATAGNQGAHIPLIEKFYEKGSEPCIIGFSLGGDPAIALAEDCKRKGIRVSHLILLDPYSWKNVPENVKMVTEFRGTKPYFARMGQIDKSRLENPNKTRLETIVVEGADHFSLLRESIPIINSVLRK